MSVSDKEELMSVVNEDSDSDPLLLKADTKGLFDDERVCCGRVRAGPYNIVMTGVVLFLAFLAFNPIQAEETNLIENAEIGLGLLYATLCLFNLFSSGVTKTIGEKYAMLLGGITFILYLASQVILLKIDAKDPSNKPLRDGIFFSTSFLMGIGGSLLYTAQGSFVSMNAPKNELGKWNGIFFLIYMSNYIVGGLITQFLGQVSQFALFLSLAGVGVCSGVALLFLYQPRRIIREAKRGYRFSILDTLRLFADKRILLLSPLFFFSGIASTFYYGIFSRITLSPVPSDPQYVGSCLAVFGAAEVIFSFLAGILSDKFGRFPVFIIGAPVLIYGGLVVAYFSDRQRYYMFFIAYGLLGGGDAVMNIVEYSTLGTFLPDRLQAGFAYLRFIIAGGTAAGFGLSLAMGADPFYYFIYTMAGWLVVAIVCVAVLHLKVASLDGPSKMRDLAEK